MEIVHLFRTPIMALLDSTVIDLVKQGGAAYGRQRLWGSLGFVITSFGLGQLLVLDNLQPLFWLHALLLGGLCVGLSRLLPIQGTGQRVDLLAGVRELAVRPGYLNFLGAMALLGAGLASYVNFMALFMLRLGGNEAQVGLAWAINGAMEIPIMFFGARLLGTQPHGRVLMGGFLGFALAWGLVGFATAPWQLLLIAGLNGICFGTFWMAVVAYASEAAPPGLGATSQALVGAAQAGLGWAGGAVIAGYLWDLTGPRSVFTTGAAMALLAAMLFFVGNRQRATAPTPVPTS
jgi:PPP family 3-phenylpropionic acid transporter